MANPDEPQATKPADKSLDQRLLPFALPGIGSEEEEVIAILSHVGEELLADYHRMVEAARQRAEQLSNVAFLAAFLAFCLFLLPDFERAPIPLLILPAMATLLLLGMGVLLRTRLVEPNRFTPPRIQRAQKLSWQWLAIPIDEERVILWDTLTDEGVALSLPQNPPRRPMWLMREPDPLNSIEDEKALLKQMGDSLAGWQIPPDGVRLPQITGSHTELVEFLGNLPRQSRRWTPAPPIPPARTLEEGQDDLSRLMHLHQNYHIFLRQLDAWEEGMPQFLKAMEQALQATLPRLEAPPAPPPAHPSGDVEALIGTLELVRSTAIEALRVPLMDELTKERSDMETRLKDMEEDWKREHNIVHYGSDTLINSLQRRIADMEQRGLPEAERALKESQTKQREAQDRVRRTEEELAEKRKQLLMAGNVSSQGPRASDERKRELTLTIERLTSTLPEMKISIKTWEDVVNTHRSALERERAALERAQKEYNEYVEERDRELEKVDKGYEQRQGDLRAQYAPTMRDIEADLAFFDILTNRFSEVLRPYRVDLIMDDEVVRPYGEITQETQHMLAQKQTAVTRWAREIQRLIEQRRDTVHQIVGAIDKAAIPNFGLHRLRLLQLPVWYVEAEGGKVTLWPWQRPKAKETVLFFAPFVEAKGGRRLALPGDRPPFLAPLQALQQRLDSVMAGERRATVQEAARRLGRVVPFDPKLLNAIALSAQMPRAMVNLLLPLHAAHLPPVRQDTGLLLPDRPEALRTGVLLPPPDGAVSLSDEFVEPIAPAPDADAWGDDSPADTPAGEDAWDADAPVSAPPVPPLSAPAAQDAPPAAPPAEGQPTPSA